MTLRFDEFDRHALPVHIKSVERKPGAYRNYFKRFLDVSLIVLTLPITAPLLAVLVIMISLDGGQPIYRSWRVGQGGRVFGMIKLRTMVASSDAMLRQRLAIDPAAKAEWDRTQKLKNDPRITRIGKVLRKTSLDELPQLWNVLRGEMSLVGPRPILAEQVSLYSGEAYYSIRPGMTGPWQVTLRNESEFCQRSHYDQQYDEELSLMTDISLLMKTIGVVFRGTGY